MIAATGLRWLLTVLFSVLALFGLARTVRPAHGGAAERVAHGLHTLMAVAMGVMVWPRGMDVPALPLVVWFAASAVWFAVAALVRVGPGSRPRALLASVPHVLLMAAMAWMLAAMDSALSGGPGGSSGGTDDMPGMDMSGGSLATMTPAGDGQRVAAGVWAVVFLVLALWWLAGGFDAARRPAGPGAGHVGGTGAHDACDLLCHGAMALGMAVMFVLLL